MRWFVPRNRSWGVEAMMGFDPREDASRDDNARWADRERAISERAERARAAFSRDLGLPRGPDRE